MTCHQCPMRYLILCTLLFLHWLPPKDLKGQRSRGDLCILWYNVENLFFPETDSLSTDLEFTPEGVRHWTFSRYHRKLTSLAKVILAAGSWEAPDLVGLCEVESSEVLEDLCSHPLLESCSYAYKHWDSPDHRGMDVACLYRSSRIDIIQWTAIPSLVKLDGTRDLMHLSLTFGKNDTLELFLAHFVSKFRGAGTTAENRRIQAAQLVRCVDSVQKIRPGGLMLIAGDFNDDPQGFSLEPLRSAPVGKDGLKRIIPVSDPLVNGSYKYRMRWIHLDQIYFRDPLGRFYASASILMLPPLVEIDKEYGGVKPRRSYQGYRYHGGISDHLPLVGVFRRIPSRSRTER